MEYAEVVSTAFATGPEWSRKYANLARQFVLIWLFLAYFGACVADNILIADNYGQVISYYMNNKSVIAANSTGVFNATTSDALSMEPVEYSLLRAIMAYLLVPLILFNWVPDLKYLAPVSTIANFFMATVIGITCYYLVQDPTPMTDLSFVKPVTEAPLFFSITLFAMENIGVIMPLENNMKTPQNFLGTCGVLNRGMFPITFVYLLLGALGYMKYGEKASPIITTNLPVTDIAAQVVKLLIGSTVLFTFSLQFYVCREMVWTRVKKYFPNRPILAEYSIRALLVIACVSIAIALPMISPLVTLVGAFGFSILGIIFPVVIELIVYWDIGYGRYNWKIFKNVFFIVFGSCSLIFGTQYAINEILTELVK